MRGKRKCNGPRMRGGWDVGRTGTGGSRWEGRQDPGHLDTGHPSQGAGSSCYVQWEIFEGLQTEVKQGLLHIESHSTLKTGTSLQSLFCRGVPHRGTSPLESLLDPNFILIPGFCLLPGSLLVRRSSLWCSSLCRSLDASIQPAQTIAPAKPEFRALTLCTLVVELLWESAHDFPIFPDLCHSGPSTPSES